MSSNNSTIEEESFGSFSEMLFSTSPHVFFDIENIIENSDDIKPDNTIINQYNIILKDLIIYHLNLKLKMMTNNYEIYHTMWNSMFEKDLLYVKYK